MPTKTDAEKSADTAPGTTPKPPRKAAAKPKADTAPKAGDSPPRKSTPPRKRPPGRPPKPKVDQLVAESVTQLGATLAVLGTGLGNDRLTYDGNVLVFNADALGHAVLDMTDTNPKMAAAIERLFTTGKTFRSAATIAGVVVPIVANHTALPASAAALVAPELVKAHGLPPGPPARPAAGPARVAADGEPVVFDPAAAFVVDDPDGPSPQQVEAMQRLRDFAASVAPPDPAAGAAVTADGEPSGASGLPAS